MAHGGVDELDRDLREMRELVGASSAIYARALEQLEDLLAGPGADAAIRAQLAAAWSARTFRAFYERPLLLLASIRADAIADAARHPLARAVATDRPDVAAIDRASLSASLAPERSAVWGHLRARKVQTNEVSRAIAWRWPASAIGARPLVLADVGCAAGLNLVADALPATWRDPAGALVPVATRARVVERVGYDAEPADVRHADEVEWLRACIWPGDHARLDRFDDAIDAMVSAWRRPDAPRIESVRAQGVPRRLDQVERKADPAATVLVYQTFVRDYLHADEAALYADGMRAWLSALPPARAMWVELELERAEGRPPATLVVHVPTASGIRSIAIGRCGYHPLVIEPDRDAFEELSRVLAAR